MLLCTPITVEDVALALVNAARAAERGADIVEFRIDGFFDPDPTAMPTSIVQLTQLVERCQLPCIVTCRHMSEGGAYDGPEDARVSMYEALCTHDGAVPAYIDIEFRAFQRSANIRQKMRLCVQHPSQLRDVKTKLILSLHDFQQVPSDLARSIAAMIDEPACSVVKVAARARNVLDAVELLDASRRCSKPAIMLGMGEFGMLSRVLAGKWGGLLTFAPLSTRDATAPGQLSLSQLADEFHVSRVRSATKVYGIVGWPVASSLSPLVHNAAFAEDATGASRAYVHLPIAAYGSTDGEEAKASQAAFSATLLELIDHDYMHFCGASVTMPHKPALVVLAKAQGWEMDEASSVIEAANTLVIERNRDIPRLANSSVAARGDPPTRVRIANTDANALRELLVANLAEHDLQNGAAPLAGKVIGVVGAGGVGAAAAWAAASAGAHVVIYNRTLIKAQQLATRLLNTRDASDMHNIVAMPLDALPRACCDAFVQCTSVGMQTEDGSAMPIAAMQACVKGNHVPLLIETVYRPRETATLQAAVAAGWRVVDGTALFVRQAELQSEMWMGKTPHQGLFAKLVEQAALK